MRRIPSVELAPGMLVTLSDRNELVKEKIKPLTVVPVVGTSIEMLHHQPSGSDLLTGRRVVAIYLRGSTAPGLKVQPLGAGAKALALNMGMEKTAVEQMLGTDYVLAPLNNPDVNYYFYASLGVGVHYGRDGKVNELVLAQIAVERE